ncbi:MAG TPA: DUF1003 domain-containing protein [Acidobacteriaceae bacterium]
MSRGPIHEHVQEHIELIARHESEFLARRTKSERIADRIAGFVGSLRYVLLHFVLAAGWILWNTLDASRAHPFDPFPYPLLDLVLAFEAIVVASFILIRQQRIGRRSEEREQLMLQILLLSEREVTAVLGIERRIAERMGLHELARDEAITQLSEQTPIDEVAQVIQEKVIQEGLPLE